MHNQTKRNSPNIIPQKVLEDWLNRQAALQTLVAPSEVAGNLFYQRVTGSQEIAWNSLKTSDAPTVVKPILSLKELFFPPTERMLTIQKIGSDVKLEEILPQEKILAFGVRPCDGRGVRILDALFLEDDPADEYYRLRRENTILAGLTCSHMGPNCFCTSLGSAPDDPAGMDLMFTQAPDGFTVEAVTPKGHEMLAEAGWQETVAGGEKEQGHKAVKLPDRQVWKSRFKDEIWKQFGERCLSCRLCTYVCPTCRCFIVRDEILANGQYERLRCWDACMGANYRMTAGGHRSRMEPGERLRNRVTCKFDYYPMQYQLGDNPACTGCGRCIDVCPVGVDILEVLEEMGEKA